MPAKIQNGVRMHLIVPKQQHSALDKLARRTGITASEHLRRALDLYLAHAAERMSRKPQ